MKIQELLGNNKPKIASIDEVKKMKVELSVIELAATDILRVAQNPTNNLTAASLQDELERGDIDGWEKIVYRHKLNFSQWSGAMEKAIAILSK